MMPGRFDLKMEGRHIVKEPGVHEVVRICPGRGAVPDRAVEETPDGLHGLQESRHAQVVEGYRHGLPLSLNRFRWCRRTCAVAEDKDSLEGDSSNGLGWRWARPAPAVIGC